MDNKSIIPSKANLVYQTIGVEYKERIIDPAIQEVMKAVSARYTAEELIDLFCWDHFGGKSRLILPSVIVPTVLGVPTLYLF